MRWSALTLTLTVALRLFVAPLAAEARQAGMVWQVAY